MAINTALDEAHLLVIRTVEDLPESAWDTAGADGDWSVKDILAHLISYEHLLLDILNTASGAEPGSYLQRFSQDRNQFRSSEVEKRRYETAQHIEDEYNDLQVQTSSILTTIPQELFERKGTVPLMGPDQSLAQIVDRLQKHTREHCEQIKQFRERTGDAGNLDNVQPL